MAVMIGLGLLSGAAAVFWCFLPRDDHTHPRLRMGPLSWVVPLLVTSLIAIGLTLTLNSALSG